MSEEGEVSLHANHRTETVHRSTAERGQLRRREADGELSREQLLRDARFAATLQIPTIAELQRILQVMSQLEAAAQAAHAKVQHSATGSAPRSVVAARQARQQITTAVVDSLSRLPDEVAHAMAKAATRAHHHQLDHNDKRPEHARRRRDEG